MNRKFIFLIVWKSISSERVWLDIESIVFINFLFTFNGNKYTEISKKKIWKDMVMYRAFYFLSFWVSKSAALFLLDSMYNAKTENSFADSILFVHPNICIIVFCFEIQKLHAYLCNILLMPIKHLSSLKCFLGFYIL